MSPTSESGKRFERQKNPLLRMGCLALVGGFFLIGLLCSGLY
ncbi:MAG: hypothetical protein ACI8S6_000829, partial [Myxococcota bacterium]